MRIKPSKQASLAIRVGAFSLAVAIGALGAAANQTDDDDPRPPDDVGRLLVEGGSLHDSP